MRVERWTPREGSVLTRPDRRHMDDIGRRVIAAFDVMGATIDEFFPDPGRVVLTGMIDFEMTFGARPVRMTFG